MIVVSLHISRTVTKTEGISKCPGSLPGRCVQRRQYPPHRAEEFQ